MNYPKRLIVKGEQDPKIVKAIQKQLNAKGCGLIDVDGVFGNQTFAAVKTFQARNADQNGNPLVIDGKIGALTWAILFGENSVTTNSTATQTLLKNTVEIAISQIGVRENPLYSNRGKEVDEYIRAVGLDPKGGYSWCAAFVYWCFQKAADKIAKTNPVFKTAGVLKHWNNTEYKRISGDDATANPKLIKPGHIFIMDFGSGTGHTGIVESVTGGFLTTIEGNTNDDGSREGYGVFRRTSRKVNSINKGFIDYAQKAK